MKIILIVVGLAVLGGSWWWLYHDFKVRQDELIEFMQSKDDFTGEEVDSLWHFKNEHGVSDEFMELYNKKIKPLPGWRP